MSEPLIVSLCLLALTVGFVLVNRFTQIGTVARGTFREAIRQPVFLFMIGVAIALFVLYLYLPFFTLGNDTQVYIDSCLATVLVSSLLLAIWTASQSVAEEREGKTIMTLLSKPITRAQFVLGKFLGILEAVLLQIFLLALVLLPATYEKFGLDAKESGAGRVARFERTDFDGRLSNEITFLEPQRTATAVSVIPPLGLVFLQVAVMTSIAVAISTRLPALVGIILCLAIFILGNLAPTLIAAAPDADNLVFLKFVAQLFATLFPGLWMFDTFTAIATNNAIPEIHLGTIAVYSICYMAAMMLVAFLLFEDEDLA